MEVRTWPIEKLIFYARNPRKHDKVVDRKHVGVVVERWQSLSGKKAILEGDGRPFDQIAKERAKEVWDAAA